MRVTLDYGTTGLPVELPDDCLVVLPDEPCPVDDPGATTAAALAAPVAGPTLSELAGPGQRVVIAVPDGTRPHPQRLALEALLAELGRAGADSDVTILVSGGTHDADAPEVLAAMLGPDLPTRCKVAIHDCRATQNLVHLGHAGPPAADVPVSLARLWVEADLRISTGLVEPHLFAGLSGGPKLVAVGCAGLDTIMALHRGSRVGDPGATWGPVRRNPVHAAIRAVAAMCPAHFSLEFVLDSAKRTTHVFAGAPPAAHQAAGEVAVRGTMRRVNSRFPLVISTSGGYPLDQNFYQAVKGISAAEEIVSDGGTIILAAECRYGLPDAGVYTDLLEPDEDMGSVNGRLIRSERVVPGQWQVQSQARVQARTRVLVKSSGLTPADVAIARLEPLEDIDAFVREARRRDPALPIAVLPHGPYCVPILA